jgi:hypothetical protein
MNNDIDLYLYITGIRKRGGEKGNLKSIHIKAKKL